MGLRVGGCRGAVSAAEPAPGTLIAAAGDSAPTGERGTRGGVVSVVGGRGARAGCSGRSSASATSMGLTGATGVGAGLSTATISIVVVEAGSAARLGEAPRVAIQATAAAWTAADSTTPGDGFRTFLGRGSDQDRCLPRAAARWLPSTSGTSGAMPRTSACVKPGAACDRRAIEVCQRHGAGLGQGEDPVSRHHVGRASDRDVHS
jgi:hypothetical protein